MYRLLLIAGLIALLTDCRGKQGPEGPQGPQGPAGQDLVRPQQGFIEGVARGKDNNGNAFNIPFRYTYYTANPGTATRRGADTLDIEFSREDSLGIGNLTISFRYQRSNGQTSNVDISGVAANISASPIPTHEIQTQPSINVPGYSSLGTSQVVTNVQISGDTVVSGDFRFIRPQISQPPVPIPGVSANSHPDTVTGRFSIRLVPVISYGRVQR